jgi:NAD(P)-dependent dehydrogenase (short-subunit alcohol dehydrogenase family)
MSNGSINPNTVMLVSGGGHGITAICVKQLAKQYQCKFILLGRSAMTYDVPAGYHPGIEADALKKLIMETGLRKGEKLTPKNVQTACRCIMAAEEIKTTIQDIHTAGGEAVYLSADVTDLAALQKEIESEAGKQFGPITAILHGAGNLADKLIEKKTIQDFHAVYSPKIIGLENLLAVVDPQKLSLVVLFSSVVGFSGNAGQSDYAMANDVLNKLGYYLQAKLPACKVLALDWGPWQSGMVTASLARAFAQRGIRLIPIHHGAQFLVDRVGADLLGSPQIIVGTELKQPAVDWHKLPAHAEVKRSLSLNKNPFLLDHVIGDNPVLPATCAAGWMMDTCEVLYPGYHVSRMETYRVLKGIVFENSSEQNFHVAVDRRGSSDENQIVLDVQIFSLNASTLPRYHYKCVVILKSEIETPFVDLALKQLSEGQTDWPTGAQLYHQGTLFHGQSFQGVKEVLKIDEKGLQMVCKLSMLNPSEQGQFYVRRNNPFINDCIVQSILVWTQIKRDAPCLPASLEAFDCYGKMDFDKPYTVEMHIRALTDTSITGDIVVFDDESKIYQRLTGLRGIISPQLKRLFNLPAQMLSGDR